MKSSQVILNTPEGAPPSVSPSNFVEFLPWACKQLMAPFQVIVIKELEKPEELPGKSTKSKTRLSTQASSTHTNNRSASSAEDDFTITLTAIYDVGDLVEMLLVRRKQIPQLLFKIIALCIPYNLALRRFTIRWSRLDGSSLYEMSKFLPQSNITEICLDDSVSYEARYDLYLQIPHLKFLSLARCKIGDYVCGNIASELEFPKSAARRLVALNLTSNMISDVGAGKLGSALRGNRQLRHLNLSGNLIADEGAAHVLRCLMEFPLTSDEILGKRMRRIAYLTNRPRAYESCVEQLNTEVKNDSPGRVGKEAAAKSKDRAKIASPIHESDEIEAKAMANEVVDAYDDPYSNEETIYKNDCVYCVGNLSLCFLNLAYNNLEYPSVVKLCEVLDYQSKLAGKRQPGLMRVLIEGNNVPVSCRELELARQFLEGLSEMSELRYNSDTIKTKK